MIDIFLSPLSYHLNGRNVAEGTARWKVADLGKEILSPKVTVQDLPWLTDRFGCSVFDREGFPTKNMTPIKGGVLKDFFLDQYAAKALGKTSTGHAVGAPSSLPSVSPHCLCLGKGDRPWKDLVKELTGHQKSFLLVHRFSGQTDPITGDFSGVAKGGEWWVGGERAYFVKETQISGNLFQALGPGLAGISVETEVVDSESESPSILIDKVSVTVAS